MVNGVDGLAESDELRSDRATQAIILVVIAALETLGQTDASDEVQQAAAFAIDEITTGS